MTRKRKGFSGSWNNPAARYWDSELEPPIESCSLTKCPTVYLSPRLLGAIQFLMKKYPKTEWAADLIGRQCGGDFYVENLYVFKQEVTATTVKREEAPPKDGVGVIHSHHTMSPHFSHIDNDFANSNHDLSGVVSFSDGNNLVPWDIVFTARVKTPCGKMVRFDEVPTRLLLPALKLEVKGKIKEKVEPVWRGGLDYNRLLGYDL